MNRPIGARRNTPTIERWVAAVNMQHIGTNGDPNRLMASHHGGQDMPEGLMAQISKIVSRIGGLVIFRHLVTSAVLLSIMCQALLLAGCNGTTSSLPFLYTLSMHYEKSSLSSEALGELQGTALNVTALSSESLLTEVKVGYFGVCVQYPVNSWKCAKSLESLPLDILSALDPYSILPTMAEYKNTILFPVIIIMSIFLSLLASIALYTLTDIKGLGTAQYWPKLKRVAIPFIFTILIASAFAYSGAMWQHTSAASVACLTEKVSHGFVKSHVGYRAVALAWVSACILVFVAGACILLIVNLFIMDRRQELEQK